MAKIETFADASLAFCASLPATYTQSGYSTLTWTTDNCLVETMPELSREWAGVESKTLCSKSGRQRKGTSKFKPVSTKVLSDWADDAQQILEDAEADADAVIAVRVTFQGGNICYFTAQVAQFAITDGGSGDDINKRNLEIWIQSDDITRVPTSA